MHWSSQIQSNSEFSVDLRQLVHSHAHSALGTLLAAWPACPEPRTRAWHLPSVGGALARLRRRVLRRPNHRSGRQGAERRHNTVHRRPNLLVAPRGHLLASTRMQHRRRGAARAERALCRRRARAAPFRRAPPKHPNPDAVST